MRYLALIKNENFTNKDSENLKKILRESGFTVYDVRIGKYIEVDYEGKEALGEKIAKTLSSQLIKEHEIEIIEEPLKLLIKEGRCWEAHETLERIRDTKYSDKEIKEKINNIIKLCAATVHYMRGNVETAIRIYNDALQKGIDKSILSDLGIADLMALIENKEPLNFFEMLSKGKF